MLREGQQKIGDTARFYHHCLRSSPGKSYKCFRNIINTFIESFYYYYIKLQVIGGFGLFSYAVSGDYSNILNVAAPILAIVIGIFGIVAASKRNLWLVGIVSYSEFN